MTTKSFVLEGTYIFILLICSVPVLKFTVNLSTSENSLSNLLKQVAIVPLKKRIYLPCKALRHKLSLLFTGIILCTIRPNHESAQYSSPDSLISGFNSTGFLIAPLDPILSQLELLQAALGLNVKLVLCAGVMLHIVCKCIILICIPVSQVVDSSHQWMITLI